MLVGENMGTRRGNILGPVGQSCMSGPNCKAGGHNSLAALPLVAVCFTTNYESSGESRALDSEALPPQALPLLQAPQLPHACLPLQAESGVRWKTWKGPVPAVPRSFWSHSLEMWGRAWTGTSCSFTILSE